MSPFVSLPLLDDSLRPPRPLVVFQSSVAQSTLPVLRELVARDAKRHAVLLCCLLYPPSAFVQSEQQENIIVVDRAFRVPEFGGGVLSKDDIEAMVKSGEYLPTRTLLSR
jgi:elongator complex protein 5